MCVKRNRLLHLNAHDRADLLDARRGAAVAGVRLCLALDDRVRKRRASGISASAAVCARQSLGDLLHALIHLNRENARGNGKDDTEQNSQSRKYGDGNQNILNLHM